MYVEVLRDAMRLGDGGVIVAVGRLGERAEWAVPTLVLLLADKRPGIRRISAEALQQIGIASEEAEAGLRRAAEHDADDRVRHAAQTALQGLRSEG